VVAPQANATNPAFGRSLHSVVMETDRIANIAAATAYPNDASSLISIS